MKESPNNFSKEDLPEEVENENNQPLTEEEIADLEKKYSVLDPVTDVYRPFGFFDSNFDVETVEKIESVRKEIFEHRRVFEGLTKDAEEKGVNFSESKEGIDRVLEKVEGYSEGDPVRAIQDMERYAKAMSLFVDDLEDKVGVKQEDGENNSTEEVLEEQERSDVSERRERVNIVNEANAEAYQEELEEIVDSAEGVSQENEAVDTDVEEGEVSEVLEEQERSDVSERRERVNIVNEANAEASREEFENTPSMEDVEEDVEEGVEASIDNEVDTESDPAARRNYGKFRKELFSVKEEYKQKEKAYKDALDGFYNQGGFFGSVNKVKRFFGFNPKLPDEIKQMQTSYRISKQKYANKFSATLEARSKMGKSPTSPMMNLETGKPIMMNRPVYREYDKNSDSARMAFLNKFVLKENSEFLKKQEVHILSEKQIAARNRILAKIANSKLKTPLILGAGATAVAFGGIPTIAALTAGFSTRFVMGRRIKGTEKNIGDIKSSFTINDLEQSEIDLLSAEVLKQKQIRNRRIVSSAAAIAAAGTVNNLDLGDLGGNLDNFEINISDRDRERLTKIWSGEGGVEDSEFDINKLNEEQKAEFFGEGKNPDSEGLDNEGKKTEMGGRSVGEKAKDGDVYIKKSGDNRLTNVEDLSIEQQELNREAVRNFVNGSETPYEIRMRGGELEKVFPSAEAPEVVGVGGSVNEEVTLSEDIPSDADEVWEKISQEIREKTTDNIGDEVVDGGYSQEASAVSNVETISSKDLPPLPPNMEEMNRMAGIVDDVEIFPSLESIDYTVGKGDKIWKITEKMFPDSFEGLTEVEKNSLMIEALASIQNDPSLLETVGVSSGNIDLIYPGDELDLSPIKEALDKVSNEGLSVSSADNVPNNSIFTKNDPGYETLYSRFENDLPLSGEKSENLASAVKEEVSIIKNEEDVSLGKAGVGVESTSKSAEEHADRIFEGLKQVFEEEAAANNAGLEDVNVAVETEVDNLASKTASVGMGKRAFSGGNLEDLATTRNEEIFTADTSRIGIGGASRGGEIPVAEDISGIADTGAIKIENNVTFGETGTILNPEDINNNIEGEVAYAGAHEGLSFEGGIENFIKKDGSFDEELAVGEFYGGDEKAYEVEKLAFVKRIDENSFDIFDKFFGKLNSSYDLVREMSVNDIIEIARGSKEEIIGQLEEMGGNIKYESFMDWVKFINESSLENINMSLSDLVAVSIVGAKMDKIKEGQKAL